MPYDDGGSRLGLLDPEQLEAILRAYFSFPQNLTLGRLKAVIETVGGLSFRAAGRPVTLDEASDALKEYDLGSLPISAVKRLFDSVKSLASSEDALSRLTLRQLEEIFRTTIRGPIFEY